MFHSVPTQNYIKKTVDKCPVLGLTFAYLCENSLFAKTQAKMIKEIEKKIEKKVENKNLFEFFWIFLKNLAKNINFKAQVGLESY